MSAPENIDHGTPEALHAALNTPFEGMFDPECHTTVLELPVRGDSIFFREGGASDRLEDLFGVRIDPRRDWRVTVGYVAEESTLAFTRVEMPQRCAGGDQYLSFERDSDGTFDAFLTKVGAPDLPLGKPSGSTFDDELVAGLHVSQVERLLELGGYTMPKLFTSPMDMLLHLTELKDQATQWHTTESKIILSSFERKATFERQMAFTATPGESSEGLWTEHTAVFDTRDTEYPSRRTRVVVSVRTNDYEIETDLSGEDLIPELIITGDDVEQDYQRERLDVDVDSTLLAQVVRSLHALHAGEDPNSTLKLL